MARHNQDIIKLLKAAGYRTKVARNGHINVIRESDGKRVTQIAWSPSDHRGHMNTLCRLRRRGIL